MNSTHLGTVNCPQLPLMFLCFSHNALHMVGTQISFDGWNGPYVVVVEKESKTGGKLALTAPFTPLDEKHFIVSVVHYITSCM